MKHTILLLGSTGQVGYEARRSLASIGKVVSPRRREWDANRLDSVNDLVAATKPTIIVNAAACTAVDKAESETELATRLNFEVPARLAQLAAERDALLVDYSTDYVFDGKKAKPYTENDQTGPLNHYGLTKLEGLNSIIASGCRHLVFRVCWVYSSRRQNFLKTIWRLAAERDSLKIVSDQWGAPTSARWIADMTAQAVMQSVQGRGGEGVYNLSPAGRTNWHQFACEIVRVAEKAGHSLNVNSSSIHPTDTAGYPTPAKRPANSCLSTQKITEQFGFEMPAWEDFVPLVIEELLKK